MPIEWKEDQGAIAAVGEDVDDGVELCADRQPKERQPPMQGTPISQPTQPNQQAIDDQRMIEIVADDPERIVEEAVKVQIDHDLQEGCTSADAGQGREPVEVRLAQDR